MNLKLYEPLTPKELKILKAAATGATNKEISLITSIKIRTVQKHIEECMNKLAVSTRTALVIKALKLEIIRLEDI